MPAAAYLRAWKNSRKKPRSSRNTWGSTSRTPGISVGWTFIPLALLFGDGLEVDAVVVALHGLRFAQEIVAGEPTEAEGDLLGAGDLEALPLLDRLDEVGRLEQRLVGSGIEPRDAAAEPLDEEI